MKKLILSLLLIPCISCLTTSEVYLPHTSRIFHKKNCVGLHDPNPIKYSSAQVALNTGGVAACSVCIKDKDLGVKHQGYTVTNYATSGSSTVSSNSQKLPPAKSKSSVAIRVLGDILVFLGLATLVAISASAAPPQTYTPPSIYTPPSTYSSSYSGGYPSSNYSTLNSAYSTTTPSYSTPSSVFNTTTPSYSTNTTTGTYIGNLSSNPYATNSTSNQYGAGSPYSSNSINNQYGTYGSPYSSKSVNNPYATNAPKLYDSNGQYRGKLSSNPYDPDSVSNPYGQYGSPYSPDSINNPYGAGSPYQTDSPNNPYGNGVKIIGQ